MAEFLESESKKVRLKPAQTFRHNRKINLASIESDKSQHLIHLTINLLIQSQLIHADEVKHLSVFHISHRVALVTRGQYRRRSEGYLPHGGHTYRVANGIAATL